MTAVLDPNLLVSKIREYQTKEPLLDFKSILDKVFQEIKDTKDLTEDFKNEKNIDPECLMKAYDHYSKKHPDKSVNEILDLCFEYFKGKKDFGEILWEIAQEFESYKQDFLTKDQLRSGVIRELDPSLLYENQAYRQMGVREISIPFSVLNSETGAIVQGEIFENLEENTIELTPVSSSNVRAAGQYRNELLVQFHANRLTPQRTYRYQFESPKGAREAYTSLTGSGSPGRWVWQNLRGHSKGETTGIKNVPEKYGKALEPYSKTGKKVIGGTTASLAEYSISNRTPVNRVQNFPELSRQLKRGTSNPTKNPQVGSRIEELLGERRAARTIGVKHQKISAQVRQLPKVDFKVIQSDANDLIIDSLEECVSYYTKKGKSEEESKKICFASMNKKQTEATEKAKQPYKEGKYYDISTLKRKLGWGERVRLEYIKDGVETFPKKLYENAQPDIIIAERIPDYYPERKGKIPLYYQQVGIDVTYDYVSGSYDPNQNRCIVSLTNMGSKNDVIGTIRHELAHAVWEYGGTPINLKYDLSDRLQGWKNHIGNKYYHTETEMFALLFETQGELKKFMNRAKIDSVMCAQEFITVYERFLKWAGVPIKNE